VPAHKKKTPYDDFPGFKTRYTSRGYCVVELDYWADPAKDEAWAENTRRGLLNDQQWRREFLRDWVTAKGHAFYPELQLNKDLYIKALPELIRGAVYRGWDFGYRKPACLWMQYSPPERRLWCIREMMPDNMDTHSFAVLIRYLSGQEDRSILAKWPKAAYWVSWLENPKSKQPRPPFFPPGCHFIDYTGPEANKVQPAVEGESRARTDYEILASKGIYLNVYSSRLEAREELVRSLLHLRTYKYPNGKEVKAPGLFIDPSCYHLINGMNGGIAYPEKGTEGNPFPKQPRKDGHYEHLHDCLGYTVVNLVPHSFEPPAQSSLIGQSMGVKETEDPIW